MEFGVSGGLLLGILLGVGGTLLYQSSGHSHAREAHELGERRRRLPRRRRA